MSTPNKLALIIFTCENRGHLLNTTITSFEKNCSYGFSKRILSIDGYLAPQYISYIHPDKLVQNCQRFGYIHNIINALNLVDTEFFFWLEDDWHFPIPINLDPLIELLQEHSNWVQIRFSKTAPLTQKEKEMELYKGIFASIYGFSANPCVCRTELIKAGFKALQETSRDEKTGFENFLSNWFSSNGKVCAVLDPGETAMVVHTGYLESTPRQWHMTASLDGTTDKYLSGMGHVHQPSLWQRCLMVYKLAWTFLRIGIYQFWSRAAYDLAFRVIAVASQLR